MGKTTIKMILEGLINAYDEVYDEDVDKFRRTVKSGFSIISYILDGIDVADPIAMNMIKNDYDSHQRYELCDGIGRGLDVSAYANPLFHEYQMHEILAGLIAGVDVSIYADPKLDANRMYVLREGLMTIPEPVMKSIRDEMMKTL